MSSCQHVSNRSAKIRTSILWQLFSLCHPASYACVRVLHPQWPLRLRKLLSKKSRSVPERTLKSFLPYVSFERQRDNIDERASPSAWMSRFAYYCFQGCAGWVWNFSNLRKVLLSVLPNLKLKRLIESLSTRKLQLLWEKRNTGKKNLYVMWSWVLEVKDWCHFLKTSVGNCDSIEQFWP